MSTDLLRTKQVTLQTGIPEGTLRWWRHRNEGPPSFKLGKKTLGKKTVVYPADKLALWIASNEAASTKVAL